KGGQSVVVNNPNGSLVQDGLPFGDYTVWANDLYEASTEAKKVSLTEAEPVGQIAFDMMPNRSILARRDSRNKPGANDVVLSAGGRVPLAPAAPGQLKLVNIAPGAHLIVASGLVRLCHVVSPRPVQELVIPETKSVELRLWGDGHFGTGNGVVAGRSI